MKNISRRYFILGVGVAVLGTFVATLGFSYSRLRNKNHRQGIRFIKNVIRKELSHLSHVDAELDTFASAWNEINKYEERGMFIRLASWPIFMGPVTAYLAEKGDDFNIMKDEIIESYLMSTDFFRNSMDESKPIHFVFIYDPRKTAV